MFFNSFHLSPDESGASSSGGDVSSSPATAPVNSSSVSAITTSDDLFKDFESKLGMGDREADDSAFGDENFGQPSESESIEEFEQGKTEQNQTENEDDDNLPLYMFKEKLGDKDIELVIENKAQLDHYLKRAAIAPEIFKENKQLKSEVAQYKERATDADEFDRMVREEPMEILNAIIEDMKEEDLMSWVKDLSQNLQQSAEQKEYFKKLRQAEYVLRQQERNVQQQKQFETQRAQAIEQENIKQVQNWRQNEFQKWSSKLPAETHSILQDMIDDQLSYASRLANEGHDVDLITLTNRLARYANTIVGSQKSINKKVGQATQAARQQATSKLQASTSQSNVGKNKNGAGVPQYKDTNQMFSDLIRRVGTGDIRLKG